MHPRITNSNFIAASNDSESFQSALAAYFKSAEEYREVLTTMLRKTEQNRQALIRVNIEQADTIAALKQVRKDLNIKNEFVSACNETHKIIIEVLKKRQSVDADKIKKISEERDQLVGKVVDLERQLEQLERQATPISDVASISEEKMLSVEDAYPEELLRLNDDEADQYSELTIPSPQTQSLPGSPLARPNSVVSPTSADELSPSRVSASLFAASPAAGYPQRTGLHVSIPNSPTTSESEIVMLSPPALRRKSVG